MRKIIVNQFMTLDGIVQAPGGPNEDTTGNFVYGGWQLSFPSDEMMNTVMDGFFSQPFELLLGRHTYDIFASFWPYNTDEPKVAIPFNRTKKYVVSHKPFEPTWENTTCVSGDVVTELNKLKQENSPDLWMYGSGNLIQTLLQHYLIDQMYLWIYPIVLGSGKRLFGDSVLAEKMELVDSTVSKTGMILATYAPKGKLEPSVSKEIVS